MRRRTILAAIGSATVAGCVESSRLGASESVPEASLLLNWKPNGLHVPYFTAKMNGYYQEQGLQLTEIKSGQGSDVSAKQVGAGNVKFAITSSDQIVNINSRGLSALSVAVVMQRSPVLLFTVRKHFGEKLTDVKQLAGKTVGSGPGMVRILTKLLLERQGVLEDVELVDTGYDTVQQLLAGKIDVAGGVFGDAIGARHQNNTIDSISVADMIPSYGHVIATGESVASDQEDAIKAFLRGTAHGAAWAHQNPEKAIDHLVESVPALEESRTIERDKWEMMASEFMLSPTIRERGWGWSKAKPWRVTYQALHSAGLLDESLKTDTVWTNEYLDRGFKYIDSYHDVVSSA